MSERVQVSLRITLDNPPPDVTFGVQNGRAGVFRQIRSGAADLSLDLTVEARQAPGREGPTFYGPAAQGSPDGRFVYVNSGKPAGDAQSCWERRAKVPLGGITRELIDAVRRQPGTVLEARIPGRARDGGPVCASVRPLDGGWRAVKA